MKTKVFLKNRMNSQLFIGLKSLKQKHFLPKTKQQKYVFLKINCPKLKNVIDEVIKQ